jgi:hypothetical protein
VRPLAGTDLNGAQAFAGNFIGALFTDVANQLRFSPIHIQATSGWLTTQLRTLRWSMASFANFSKMESLEPGHGAASINEKRLA